MNDEDFTNIDKYEKIFIERKVEEMMKKNNFKQIKKHWSYINNCTAPRKIDYHMIVHPFVKGSKRIYPGLMKRRKRRPKVKPSIPKRQQKRGRQKMMTRNSSLGELEKNIKELRSLYKGAIDSSMQGIRSGNQSKVSVGLGEYFYGMGFSGAGGNRRAPKNQILGSFAERGVVSYSRRSQRAGREGGIGGRFNHSVDRNMRSFEADEIKSGQESGYLWEKNHPETFSLNPPVLDLGLDLRSIQSSQKKEFSEERRDEKRALDDQILFNIEDFDSKTKPESPNKTKEDNITKTEKPVRALDPYTIEQAKKYAREVLGATDKEFYLTKSRIGSDDLRKVLINSSKPRVGKFLLNKSSRADIKRIQKKQKSKTKKKKETKKRVESGAKGAKSLGKRISRSFLSIENPIYQYMDELEKLEIQQLHKRHRQNKSLEPPKSRQSRTQSLYQKTFDSSKPEIALKRIITPEPVRGSKLDRARHLYEKTRKNCSRFTKKRSKSNRSDILKKAKRRIISQRRRSKHSLPKIYLKDSESIFVNQDRKEKISNILSYRRRYFHQNASKITKVNQILNSVIGLGETNPWIEDEVAQRLERSLDARKRDRKKFYFDGTKIRFMA